MRSIRRKPVVVTGLINEYHRAALPQLRPRNSIIERHTVRAGAFFYYAVSLLAQAAARYGGCETAGIPALALRRRPAVCCVFNGVDLAERRLRARPGWLIWTAAALTFLLTLALIAATLAVAGSAGFSVAYLFFLLAGYLISTVRTTAAS